MRTAWCAAALVSLAACSSAEKSPPVSELKLGTAVQGSGFLSLGQALEPLVEGEFPNIRLDVLKTDGALDNIRGLSNGTLDLAFVFADVAFEGVEGQGPLDLRALAVLQVTPMHLIASANSGITGVGGLRHKRVAVGSEGTGTLVLARALLDAYKIGDEIERVSAPLPDALAMIRTGDIDAGFNLAAYSEGLARTLEAGAHLVAIEGAPLDDLRRTRPFLRRVLIPVGTYQGVPATATIGVQTLLVCRASLDNLLARDVTRAFVHAMAKLPNPHRWSPVPSEEAAATSLPLHPGAARYFREEQLLR